MGIRFIKSTAIGRFARPNGYAFPNGLNSFEVLGQEVTLYHQTFIKIQLNF